jgi:redox-sensitive bicupin YhaK (pirin superfamily)
VLVDDVEITPSREATVAQLTVHRALPNRGRRTVGAWCFADHMGPLSLTPDRSVDVAPHPHIGLQTVTWLFSGEFLHRDSLGSEQLIRAGQLNLMTSGHGIAHSEENPGRTSGELHGLQLWAAQPSNTRDAASEFVHLAELPKIAVQNATATVLVGEFADAHSTARRDSDLVGVELDFRGGESTFGLDPNFEYALIVVDGEVNIASTTVRPGELAYLGRGADECRFTTSSASRAVLIGGVPFDERVLMWWNFVARTQEEISDAWRAWATGDERFGKVTSPFDRIEIGPPPWMLPTRSHRPSVDD